VDGADIQGKVSMVKHLWLAKICKNRKSFPPQMIKRIQYVSFSCYHLVHPVHSFDVWLLQDRISNQLSYIYKDQEIMIIMQA